MLYAVLYRLGTGAYFLLIRLAALFNPKAAKFVKGRMGLLSKMQSDLQSEKKQRIWVHCASLGEFEQGRPVMDALQRQFPEYALILTFFSPSGYEVRSGYTGVDHVYYLPVDTPSNANRFLDIIKPSLSVFIKYELWLFFLKAIHQRGIPALLVSAVFQPKQGFFRWYGGLQRSMLRNFTHVFVQDKKSYTLLKDIGITDVTVSGDTRFDRVIRAADETYELPMANSFCNGAKVLVAGSTWPADEALIAAALPMLPPRWKVILVPHEVEESHLRDIEKLFDNQLYRWSSGNVGPEHRVLLVDKVGLLMTLYRYGHVAWIGGGFGKEGVHNVLEAAVYGVPCLFGPVYHQFIEAKALVGEDGAEVIKDATALAHAIKTFDEDASAIRLAGAAAREYVLSNGGATAKVMGEVARILG